MEVKMRLFGLLLPLPVFVVFSDCVPVGNTTVHRGNSIPLEAEGLNSKIEMYTRSTPVKTIESTASRISETQLKPIPAMTSPKCGLGTTFREKVDNYPRSYLENVLQKATRELLELLRTDQQKLSDFINRFDFDNNTETLCASEKLIVYPQAAISIEGKCFFIVNHGSYVQSVELEKCLKVNNGPKACLFSESFPQGYKATCEQKYISQKLLACNEEGKLDTVNFPIPSCCTCIVVNNPYKNLFEKLSTPLGSITTISTTAKAELIH